MTPSRPRTPRPLALSALSALAALALAALVACEDLKRYDQYGIADQLLGESCDDTAAALSATLDEEGRLSEEVAEEAPYPMSIIVSQEALNRLLREVADTNVDPIDVTLGSVLGVDVSAEVSPEVPLIQIEAVEGCPTCITAEVSFGLAVRAAGFTIGAEGEARFQLPIRMEPEGLERTRVFGDFDRATFERIDIRVTDDADFSVPFVDLSVNDLIDLAEPTLTEYTTTLVQEGYGAVELFELEPWQIGDGDIRLLGRGPLLYPEHRTLVLGVHTNLVRPLSSSVGLEPALPEGADIGLQLHPELVQVMVQRMMHEGHIARAYSGEGEAMGAGESSSAGDALGVGSSFDVTLSTLEQSTRAPGLLTAGFTLWSPEGVCGSAELVAELGASVGDAGVALTAQDIRVERGEGAFGFLAESADSWLNSDFMRDVIDVSEFTLNYDEMNLPNNKKAQMSAETFRLEVGGSGFNIFLNLDGVVER